MALSTRILHDSEVGRTYPRMSVAPELERSEACLGIIEYLGHEWF